MARVNDEDQAKNNEDGSWNQAYFERDSPMLIFAQSRRKVMLLHYLPNRHPFSGISIFEFADAVKNFGPRCRPLMAHFVTVFGIVLLHPVLYHCGQSRNGHPGGYKHTDILLD